MAISTYSVTALKKHVISTTSGRRNPLDEAGICPPGDVSLRFDMTFFIFRGAGVPA
jgi:hypothetical protein